MQAPNPRRGKHEPLHPGRIVLQQARSVEDIWQLWGSNQRTVTGPTGDITEIAVNHPGMRMFQPGDRIKWPQLAHRRALWRRGKGTGGQLKMACKTRATDSKRHGVPRRVRCACWFSLAAIRRIGVPSRRNAAISASADCSPGSASRCCSSIQVDSRRGLINPFSTTTLMGERVARPSPDCFSPLAHAVMMFKTRRPAVL